MGCQCNWCKFYQRFLEWEKSLPPEAKDFAHELYDKLNYVEDDNNYQMAILDGSWPKADEIIKSIREKRKEKDESRRKEENSGNSNNATISNGNAPAA